jgi:hypothetical protein
MGLAIVKGARVAGGRMSSLPPRESGAKSRQSGAFLSLVAISLHELRRDLVHLIDSRWDEAIRRRAHELAGTLADACERQAMADLAGLVRPMANLARLPKPKALPVLAELRREFDGLLRDAESQLGRYTKKVIG